MRNKKRTSISRHNKQIKKSKTKKSKKTKKSRNIKLTMKNTKKTKDCGIERLTTFAFYIQRPYDPASEPIIIQQNIDYESINEVQFLDIIRTILRETLVSDVYSEYRIKYFFSNIPPDAPSDIPKSFFSSDMFNYVSQYINNQIDFYPVVDVFLIQPIPIIYESHEISDL